VCWGAGTRDTAWCTGRDRHTEGVVYYKSKARAKESMLVVYNESIIIIIISILVVYY
jgi:hypothetical protein